MSQKNNYLGNCLRNLASSNTYDARSTTRRGLIQKNQAALYKMQTVPRKINQTVESVNSAFLTMIYKKMKSCLNLNYRIIRSLQHKGLQPNIQQSGCNSSKHPVPLPTTRPTTSLDDGETKRSVSPERTAPRRKCVVVSKLIF